MPSQFYVIRHGQTQYNAEQRLQGQCNSNLTELGCRQAQAVGESLAARVFAEDWTIVSSPLGRAVQTAHLIAKAISYPESDIQLDDRLMEFNLGDWEAQVAPEIKAQHPEFIGSKDWYLHAPHAERYEQVCARLQQWLDDPQTPERVIVVSHALTGSVLRGLLTGLSREQVFTQPRPQDAYFYVEGGQIQTVPCAL
ncbi:histidine phosphatase family protein [Celerinatantimonas sp. YJH-8]|uniref:histidine phosphatase family protein n=1 Tax=Celerinatantimonas sp. YJH-8 TaxID=3228714 RepID=UPI0038C71029